ncbi:MAG: PilZ domain-containing protein [Deltaproteobacteria bacterium]|nr:PilZ domain-containing protein [Deltaproteobacteria bacterium]
MSGNDALDTEFVLLRSDRRKTLRADLLVLEIKGEDDNGVFFGYARNLSKGGLYITTINPREVGSEFAISFKLPGEGTVVKCKCRVMWSKAYKPNLEQRPGMGIRFIGLNIDLKEKIEEWAKTLDRD